MDTQNNQPQPPDIPPIERRLRFYWLQLLGMPVIMAVPLLALLGVFEPNRQTASATSAALELRVEYPDRIYYHVSEPIHVTVTNLGQATAPISITFDAEYINSFAHASFTPDVADERGFVVVLDAIGPGETRVVALELEAEALGRHEGAISATSGGAPPASVEIGSLALP
jgi:hypothetical protein